MVRCMIVDDEPLARELLAAYIQQLQNIQCVAVCRSAGEAYTVLQQQSIDVVFLDIQMPGINGLNFLKSLKTHPRVIFTTAYPDHAVEAFELEAVDYLVKPITFERFSKAVRKLLPRTDQVAEAAPAVEENPYLFLKVNKRLLKIDHKDLLYAESLGDYLRVYTSKEAHISYMTLGRLEELLPVSRFVRIHRSTLVNLQHVQYVEKNIVRIHGKDLPVGLTYKNNFLQKLSQVARAKQ